jgi:hypothetical protein
MSLLPFSFTFLSNHFPPVHNQFGFNDYVSLTFLFHQDPGLSYIELFDSPKVVAPLSGGS